MRPHRIYQAVNSSVISAHLISRALDRKMILDDIAKEKFRHLLAQQCSFSQIELVTFCLMGNDWHLCVSLDTAKPNALLEASDDVFLDHLGLIYSETVSGHSKPATQGRFKTSHPPSPNGPGGGP